MKNGNITDAGALYEGELDIINRFARKPLEESEIYAFTVTLCDNDIDRDYERFSDEALSELCSLFVGKTGIFDHSHKAENQTARIFSCRVLNGDGKTLDGRAYKYLSARAYMLRSEKNAELIREIDAGIKKEVSVGCKIEERRCSVCGKSRLEDCTHKAGKKYKGALCHTVLSNATDAYEWSFVAVPAQRRAGVVKHKKEQKQMDREVMKMLASGEEITLTGSEAAALLEEINSKKTLSAIGQQYLNERRNATLKALSALIPNASEDVLKSVCESLPLSLLDELYKASSAGCVLPQLLSQDRKNKNNGFMIK